MFHRTHAILLVTFGLALSLGANMALAAQNPLFGRWTLKDDKTALSAKGNLYKTIDIVSCSKDFCGVSVDDKNLCGQTLFHVPIIDVKNGLLLEGLGKWGTLEKKIEIQIFIHQTYNKPDILLALGEDDMSLARRVSSIPIFVADYKKTGQATCTAGPYQLSGN
jgi:hypothetical protein